MEASATSVGVVAGHDDAPRQGRLLSRFYLHLYDAGDADGRRAATDQDRMFFPRRRCDRREGAATRPLTKLEGDGNATCYEPSSIDRDDERTSGAERPLHP